MQNRLVFRFAVLAVLAVSVGIYRYMHKGEPGFNDSSHRGEQAPQKTSEADLGISRGDRAMRSKLAPAIDCLNDELSHFESMESDYHQEVKNLITPPSRDIRHFDVNTLFSNPVFFTGEEDAAHASRCADTLDKAAGTAPAVADFDAAAREDAADLRALGDPGRQMDSYLQQKAYVDDHFAKGRTLDATLSPLLTKMNKATGQLREAMRRENTVLDQHRLDALEKANGRTLPWHTQRAMLAARALNDRMKADLRGNRLDANAAGADIEPLQTAVDDAQVFIRSHPGVEKANSNGFKPLWFSINGEFDSELASAREVKEFLQAPPPSKTPQELREELYKKFGYVNSSFNQLVSMYNEQIQVRGPVVVPPPGQ